MIDWTDPNCKVTDHFSVKELLWLPSWGRLANEDDGLNDTIKSGLVQLANKMEIVRSYLNSPLNVHVTYRPSEYNKQIGGSPNSSHCKGLAMDFNPLNMDCDKARELLFTCLDQWDMFMEDKPGSNWVHLNCNDGVKRSSRFFKP